ncbi:hypothetical protein EC968_005344 [Mortierella alpina]|nr:hypothetical protein EC968_005344 [Mortierella alpina]
MHNSRSWKKINNDGMLFGTFRHASTVNNTMTDDIDMQDAAIASSSVSSPATPMANDNPDVVPFEPKAERKQKEIDRWKLELLNSQADWEDVSHR